MVRPWRLNNGTGNLKILILALFITLVGVYLTLDLNLWLKIMGLPIMTFGFFGSHSIASSWVGRCALHNKAQASSLYLFFYYAGSSIGGTTAGVFWSSFGWGGVAGLITGFLLTALLLASLLAKLDGVDFFQAQHQVRHIVAK